VDSWRSNGPEKSRIAWWHTIYLLKLPCVEKKLRVALDWTLDLFFSKDFAQDIHTVIRWTPYANA
jgi:hypothetical protein